MNRVETLMSFFGGDTPPLREHQAVQETPAWHAALVAEAAAKSSVLWIKPLDDNRNHLAWHIWHHESVYVVSGPGEQTLPLLSGPVELTIASKDDRSALVSCTATATVCAAGSPEWDDVAPILATARLNTDLPDELVLRWATEALIYRITPESPKVVGAGTSATSSGAQPTSTLGITTKRRPWHLGRRH